MNCPACQHERRDVTDSRAVYEGKAVRRRSRCRKCQHAWTTYEWAIAVEEMRALKGDAATAMQSDAQRKLEGIKQIFLHEIIPLL